MKAFSNFTPNLYPSQILTSFASYFQSKKTAQKFTSILKTKLSKQYRVKPNQMLLTFGARAALYAYLENLKTNNKSANQVIILGYTCRVVLNPILKLGLKPVFVDLESDSLRMSVDQINQNINSKTLAIIIQNTFGAMEDIQTIHKIKSKAKLICDNAHFLPNQSEIEAQKQFYDAAIFSYGTNKTLSGSNLGALVDYKRALPQNIDHNLAPLPNSIANKQLTKNWLFSFSMLIYNFLSIGKALMLLVNKLGLINKVVSPFEKHLKIQDINYYKAHPKLSLSLLHSLKFYQKQITHRVLIKSIYLCNLDKKLQIEKYFHKAIIFFPIRSKNPKKLQKYLLKHGFQVNLDWTGALLVPKAKAHPENFSEVKLKNSNLLQKQLVLLPLNRTISPSKAVVLSELINKYEQ